MAPYQTVQHRPGPSWRPGVAFREQPRVERHFATMRRWLDDGVLLVGGPYLDDGGGGMVITRYPTLEAAVTAANGTPPSRPACSPPWCAPGTPPCGRPPSTPRWTRVAHGRPGPEQDREASPDL